MELGREGRDADAVIADLEAKRGRDARWHALHDGEDHELVATLASSRWERSATRLRRTAPELVRIGTVRQGRGLYLPARADSGPGELEAWSGKGGWVHGD